jgi:hypothetical protein
MSHMFESNIEHECTPFTVDASVRPSIHPSNNERK